MKYLKNEIIIVVSIQGNTPVLFASQVRSELIAYFLHRYNKRSSCPRKFFLCHPGEFSRSLEFTYSRDAAPLSRAISSLNLPGSNEQFNPIVLLEIFFRNVIMSCRNDYYLVIFCIDRSHIVSPCRYNMRAVFPACCYGDPFCSIHNFLVFFFNFYHFLISFYFQDSQYFNLSYSVSTTAAARLKAHLDLLFQLFLISQELSGPGYFHSFTRKILYSSIHVLYFKSV